MNRERNEKKEIQNKLDCLVQKAKARMDEQYEKDPSSIMRNPSEIDWMDKDDRNEFYSLRLQMMKIENKELEGMKGRVMLKRRLRSLGIAFNECDTTEQLQERITE